MQKKNRTILREKIRAALQPRADCRQTRVKLRGCRREEEGVGQACLPVFGLEGEPRGKMRHLLSLTDEQCTRCFTPTPKVHFFRS